MLFASATTDWRMTLGDVMFNTTCILLLRELGWSSSAAERTEGSEAGR